MFRKVKEKQEFTRKKKKKKKKNPTVWDVSIHFRSLEDTQNHGNRLK